MTDQKGSGWHVAANWYLAFFTTMTAWGPLGVDNAQSSEDPTSEFEKARSPKYVLLDKFYAPRNFNTYWYQLHDINWILYLWICAIRERERMLFVVNTYRLIVGGIEVHPGPITKQLRQEILGVFNYIFEEYSESNVSQNHRKQVESLRNAFEGLVSIIYCLMYETNQDGLLKIKTDSGQHLLNHGWWIKREEMLKHFPKHTHYYSEASSKMGDIIRLRHSFPVRKPSDLRGKLQIDLTEPKFRLTSVQGLVEEMFHLTKELFLLRIGIQGETTDETGVPCVCPNCKSEPIFEEQMDLLKGASQWLDDTVKRQIGNELKIITSKFNIRDHQLFTEASSLPSTAPSPTPTSETIIPPPPPPLAPPPAHPCLPPPLHPSEYVSHPIVQPTQPAQPPTSVEPYSWTVNMDEPRGKWNGVIHRDNQHNRHKENRYAPY